MLSELLLNRRLKLPSGEVEYNLGEEIKVEDINKVLILKREDLLIKLKDGRLRQTRKGDNKEDKESVKRKSKDTPQKGARRKLKPTASTPKK